MKTEIEKINKDINDYQNMNKDYESLSKDVQNLEGELADYNLASDKLRSNMRVEDIEAIYKHISMSNKKKRDESDILFIEKSKKQEELMGVEYEIGKIYNSIEQKLNDLDPDQKQEYEKLREDNQLLMQRQLEIRDEVSKLAIELAEGEGMLRVTL